MEYLIGINKAANDSNDMVSIIINDKTYTEWIASLSSRYRQSQLKAAVRVNTERLRFYWVLGRDIVELHAESKWGEGFYKNLSRDLKALLPEANCFSETNLKYMKYFYQLYKGYIGICPQAGDKMTLSADMTSNEENIICPQVGGELSEPVVNQVMRDIFMIPWGHHKLLIDKFRETPEKALFFIRKTIENGWSRALLLNFVDSDLYERQGKSITNFKSTLPVPMSDLAQEILKDPYNFDFVEVAERYREKELKEALINNITKFLIELGSGFAYMGREYRLQVNTREQFMDLLFYNTRLHSYLVIEVKTTEFEPSYLGQLSGYISFTNHILKTEHDNPTIGLLICKTKDNIFAQYSLEGYNQPIGISEFQGVNILPEDFKSSLPSIEEIEAKLEKVDK